jgi:hypothetical protein
MAETRKLTAILAVDVAGCGRLAGAVEEGVVARRTVAQGLPRFFLEMRFASYLARPPASDFVRWSRGAGC